MKEIIISILVKHQNDPSKYVKSLQNIGGYHFYGMLHDRSKLHFSFCSVWSTLNRYFYTIWDNYI